MNAVGSSYIVEVIELEIVGEPETVYYYHVEDYYTYYVGICNVLVHNNNYSNTSKGANTPERIDIENFDPGKQPGNIHYRKADNTKWYLDLEKRFF